MNKLKVFRWVCTAAIMLAGLGMGCGNGGEQIPLAKVPPPPPGFGEMKKTASTPKGGSPENSAEYTK